MFTACEPRHLLMTYESFPRLIKEWLIYRKKTTVTYLAIHSQQHRDIGFKVKASRLFRTVTDFQHKILGRTGLGPEW